jgi:predicted methyltransferase
MRWRYLAVVSLTLIPALAFGGQDTAAEVERILDAIGVEPGMVVGEAGAGDGFHAVRLARRVGPTGEVYANEIKRSALRRITSRARKEGITNISTVLGSVADAGFPRHDLDLVYMRHVLHCMAMPDAWLITTRKYLSPDGRLVIVDADPDMVGYGSDYLLKKDDVLEIARAAGFELDRIETFLLPEDYIYIFRVDPDASPRSIRSGERLQIFLHDSWFLLTIGVGIVVATVVIARRRTAIRPEKST